MDARTAQLLQRASALRQSGRIEEAIAAYSEVLEREPDLPESWYNLGWLQRQARQYEAALDSYAEALRRGASGPEEVHLNRAVILSDHLGRPEQAGAELEAALAIKPDYVPALINLGNLHEDLGRREDAQAAYRRALEADPGSALVLARLAGVTEANSGAASELIDGIERALVSTANPAARADLGFALGRLLDARGDYEAAFEAYAHANRASRESFGPRTGYDREEQERLVDRLMASFPKPVAASGDEAAPIFICGMFRSGSTLVEQILASHSGIVAGGELDLIPTLATRISGYPEAVAEADERTVDEWRQFYLDGAARLARDGKLMTDKRPDNFLHIGLIKTLFPKARVVHTRRDRLDNLLSLYFLHLGPGMPYALDLSDAAHWYGQYERLMAHWKRLYPNEIFDVDYDALVREPLPPLERLVGFLGVGWEGSLLDFHRREGAVKTASVWQVREPLHARSSGRWRNYREQLERSVKGRQSASGD